MGSNILEENVTTSKDETNICNFTLLCERNSKVARQNKKQLPPLRIKVATGSHMVREQFCIEVTMMSVSLLKLVQPDFNRLW